MAASTSFLSAIALALLCLSTQTTTCRSFQAAARPRAVPAAPRQRRPRRCRRGTTPCPASTGRRAPCCASPRMAAGDEDDDGDGGTRLEPRPGPPPSPADRPGVKLFDIEDAFEDDGENVVGTKFFGGSAQKEELFVETEEERAVELLQLARPSSSEAASRPDEYRRFEDADAFGDAVARRTGAALQAAINRILYDEEDDGKGEGEGGVGPAWREDPSLRWDTPFPKARGSPLAELVAAKDFYNKLDVAILSARTVASSEEGGRRQHVVEARWDVGAVWPNPWESRVLLTGTSELTLREDGGGDGTGGFALLRQVDRLDGGDAGDVVGRLASQLSPRFWDVYHIGMSPSCELDPRLSGPPAAATGGALASSSTAGNVAGRKGPLSGYRLSHLPPRLVTEPSFVDDNGRSGRAAQGLPNHAFTTAIRTAGKRKEAFVPVSPIEVSISKVAAEYGGGSRVRWSVPVPPASASRAVLPLPVLEDEAAEGDDDDSSVGADDDASAEAPLKIKSDTLPDLNALGRVTRPPPAPPRNLACGYSLRPPRLVATLPYAGNPQDEEVAELRRRLYQQVVEKDGFAPKLDPQTKRPVFFFWMNDVKACFTRAGGLGMAVYEWRAKASKSNEVGIELEC